MTMLILKSYNKGYVRKDGAVINPFSDKRVKATSHITFGGAAKRSSGPKAVKHPGPMPMPKHPGSAADYAAGALKQSGSKGGGQKLAAPQYGISGKPAFGGESGGPKSGMFGGGAPTPKPKPQAWHPKRDEHGKPVPIYKKHDQGEKAHWYLPHATGTFLPGGDTPPSLNGVAFKPWHDAPKTEDDWANAPGQKPDLNEPPFGSLDVTSKSGHTHKLEQSAGVVVEEPDGRVWLICPTNRFGGYKATYPKGHVDGDENMQAAAIREAFEETGLQVEITGFVGDFAGSTTKTRYYRAKRVGGTPSEMGWEAQAIKLVPKDQLEKHLNISRDQKIAEAIQAPA